MKSRVLFLALLLGATLLSCAPKSQTIVILSTNDIHSTIDKMPQLATAVQQCRDTAEILYVVDAGDRWTGNPYVDRAPMKGMPIIELMNHIGYDYMTLGNHAFDFGQAHLGATLKGTDAEVICANVISDTISFPQLPASAIATKGGVKVGFVGVITNYEGDNHPAGNKSSYVGVRFPDPQQRAIEEGEALQDCDLTILLSHMGHDRDIELIGKSDAYDILIGGHTHEILDTLISNTLLTQTGNKLRNIGVTRVKMVGNKVESIEYDNIPLSQFEPDAKTQQLVDAYKADKDLNTKVGTFDALATKVGLANWMSESIKGKAKTNIGVYHVGGVRLDTLQKGDITKANIYMLEPFGTKIARATMTPEQIRKMVITKYNDPINKGEAKRVDLVMTEPYEIITKDGEAVDVIMPTLRKGKRYTIALSNYIYNNYKGLEYTDGDAGKMLVTDALYEDLGSGKAVKIDNTPKQTESK